jgi:hypothetical protein
MTIIIWERDDAWSFALRCGRYVIVRRQHTFSLTSTNDISLGEDIGRKEKKDPSYSRQNIMVRNHWSVKNRNENDSVITNEQNDQGGIEKPGWKCTSALQNTSKVARHDTCWHSCRKSHLFMSSRSIVNTTIEKNQTKRTNMPNPPTLMERWCGMNILVFS